MKASPGKSSRENELVRVHFLKDWLATGSFFVFFVTSLEPKRGLPDQLVKFGARKLPGFFFSFYRLQKNLFSFLLQHHRWTLDKIQIPLCSMIPTLQKWWLLTVLCTREPCCLPYMTRATVDRPDLRSIDAV